MNKPFDFHPSHRNPKIFLGCEFSRDITDGEVFSARYMTDEELRQSIVADILAVTIWEKQTEQTLEFGCDEFYRFVDDIYLQRRILDQFTHPEIEGLLDIDEDHKRYRIRDQKEILQAAMGYCGVYYHGYDAPEGLVTINRDAIENMGGVETAAMSLLMDIAATVPEVTTTLN